MKVMTRSESLEFIRLGGSVESIAQNVVNALVVKIAAQHPNMNVSQLSETAKHMVMSELMVLLENPAL